MAEIAGHARALALIPSGLFVLSTGRGAALAAILVSFVQQIGFTPPAVALALRKGRGDLLDLLRAERAFCLAVIPADGRGLVARFAGGPPPGADPFAGMPTAVACNGVRYPAGACAHLACQLVGEADWTDHLLLCGHVIGGAADPDAKPWVHLRKNGLSY